MTVSVTTMQFQFEIMSVLKALKVAIHYENMSVQHEAIYKCGKNDIFRCQKFFLFLLKT